LGQPKAWEKALSERDRADWHKYQISLSIPEMRMKADAMLNVRLTLRHLTDGAAQGAENNLTEGEKGSYLRMLVNQLSQIEHRTIETWREARRSRIMLTISICINVSLGLLLLVALLWVAVEVRV